MLITSPRSRVVKSLRELAKEREAGRVLLEGPRVIREAVACGVELDLLAVREGTEFEAPAAEVVSLGAGAFAAASQTVTPQGALAVGRYREGTVGEALDVARRAGWPLLVLDAIQDPGNTGAICRTAAAAGAPAVAVLDGGADPFGPKAIRASAGNVFRLLVARATWQDLRQIGGYGAAAAGGVDPAQVDLGGADLLALGSEARGLRRHDLQPVTIPLAPGVESLNVAAAAAVLLFEVRRKMAA